MTDAVTTERDLDADPATVWEAISEPDRLGQWLDAAVDVDISEGSEGTIVFGDGEEPAVVLVETVEEGERLVFRWASTVDAPTEVSIELEPITTGTRVRVIERVIPQGVASPHAARASIATQKHGAVRTHGAVQQCRAHQMYSAIGLLATAA